MSFLFLGAGNQQKLHKALEKKEPLSDYLENPLENLIIMSNLFLHPGRMNQFFHLDGTTITLFSLSYIKPTLQLDFWNEIPGSEKSKKIC